jgi:hypothetical protein
MSKILSLKNKETYIALGFFAGMAIITIVDFAIVITALLSMYTYTPAKTAKRTLDGSVIPQAIQLLQNLPEEGNSSSK